MHNDPLHESMDMPDPRFPVKVFKSVRTEPGEIFAGHWHEHIELLYILEGEAVIECDGQPYDAAPGDFIVVNGCELHRGVNASGRFACYCIILDTALLLRQLNDLCQAKYITPIAQNQVLFCNRISGDREINGLVGRIAEGYGSRQTGYELEIVSSVYHLFVLLLRRYEKKYLSDREYGSRMKNFERFNAVFKRIESDYAGRITVRQCAKLLNITDSHFCHLFKELTGTSLGGYVNRLRLSKAETLLKKSDRTVTEIALSAGFNDIAYFTRLFTKTYGLPPSRFRTRERDRR